MEDEAAGGPRLAVYDDKSGHTIEHGPAGGNPTIGYGRNLAGRGLLPGEAEMMLDNDLALNLRKIQDSLPWIATIPPVWCDVIEMIQYNTGDVLGWPHMLSAMQSGDADGAIAEIASSHADGELPARYGRLMQAIVARSWDPSTWVPLST